MKLIDILRGRAGSRKPGKGNRAQRRQTGDHLPSDTITRINRGRTARSDDLTSTILEVSGDFSVETVDLPTVPTGMVKGDASRLTGRRLVTSAVTGAVVATLAAGAAGNGVFDMIGVYIQCSVPLTEALPPAVTYTLSFTDDANVVRSFNAIIAPRSHSFALVILPGFLIAGVNAHVNPRLTGGAPGVDATLTIAGVSATTATRVTALGQGNSFYENLVAGRFAKLGG